jgi:hypothetical protein
MSAVGYRAALRTSGAAGFFFGAAPGRVGIAMTGLGIVWTVYGSTGSFGQAGIVTGGFAVAEGCIGPQVARLIDRRGQPRVLPYSLAAHVAAITALIALACARSPVWLLAVAGVLAGASIPQLGALTSARWAWLLSGDPLLSRGFALESLSNEVAYLVGPALVATVATVATPVAGSALAAVLVTAGGGALICQRRTAPPAGPRDGEYGGATLLHRGFAVLIGVHAGIGLYFGSMQVTLTAFAVDHGVPGAAGLLYGVTGVASLVAGVGYGRRSWRASHSRQLARVLTLLAAGCVPLLVATSVPELAVALIGPSLAVAPALIVSALLTESLVDPSLLTQAFTWQNSASAAGTALAAGLVGQAIDTNGTRWGFAIALGGAAAVAVFVRVNQRGLAGHRRP